jgi:hypothetical protein
MKKLPSSYRVKATNISILLVLIMYGCQSSTRSPPQSQESLGNNHTGYPPCRPLHVLAPLFNVTGSFTTGVNPNSSIYLFVAPDTSLDSSLYVVESCPAIANRAIIDEDNFTFENLPGGDYVAMVPRDSFPGKTQGFPIVHEFNGSDYFLKFNFYGGNWKYSVVSFSIRPSSERPKTEK